LFGTTASITDEQIKALELNKVVILYVAVGLLFLAAAALFYFRKKFLKVFQMNLWKKPIKL
jgi:FHS family L-fucose permease-like MFS transporter